MAYSINGLSSTDAFLDSIDQYGEGNMWAVGTYYDSSTHIYKPLLVHYDGSSWQAILDVRSPGLGYTELHSVFMTSQEDVWIVSEYGVVMSDSSYPKPRLGSGTLILHWHGSSFSDVGANFWDKVSSTNPGTSNQLLAVAALPGFPNQGNYNYVTKAPIVGVWAVGNYQNGLINSAHPLIESLVAPAAPSIVTTSYYEQSTDATTHYQQGCAAARNGETGIIILDYGRPVNTVQGGSSATYGTRTVSPPDSGLPHHLLLLDDANSSDDIRGAIFQFAKGYYDWQGTQCTNAVPHSFTPMNLILAVGINNDIYYYVCYANHGLTDRSPTLTDDYAKHWSSMVSAIQSDTSFFSGIKIVSAIDAEPDYGRDYVLGDTAVARATKECIKHPAHPEDGSTRIWTNGYNTRGVSLYYNFGSTDGRPCPSSNRTGLPECSGWSADQLYEVSWGFRRAAVLPEIYKAQFARYWYLIQRWSYDHIGDLSLVPQGIIRFAGVSAACKLPSGCSQDEYDKSDGWRTFWLQLQADPTTKGYNLQSDIQNLTTYVYADQP